MELDLVLIYGYNIKALLQEIQVKIRNEVEKLTALNIKSINIVARSLVVNPAKPSDRETHM